MPINILPILHKYIGTMATVDRFAPRPLNTTAIENVEAGAKIKLYLRPVEELNAEELEEVSKSIKVDGSSTSIIVIKLCAGIAEELRKRGYDMDSLFTNGYAYHIDTVNIF